MNVLTTRKIIVHWNVYRFGIVFRMQSCVEWSLWGTMRMESVVFNEMCIGAWVLENQLKLNNAFWFCFGISTQYLFSRFFSNSNVFECVSRVIWNTVVFLIREQISPRNIVNYNSCNSFIFSNDVYTVYIFSWIILRDDILIRKWRWRIYIYRMISNSKS